jgi:hypothetical protein
VLGADVAVWGRIRPRLVGGRGVARRGPVGSRGGKMLREARPHLYWTLYWGAHTEHFRAPGGPRASSVRLAHPI